MFVLDIPYDFFQQVLHGHQPCRTPVFICHGGHLHMLVLHQLEDLGDGHAFRHHIDFPHDGPEIEARLLIVRIHKLPDMDHPQDMVPILFTKGIAGMPRFPDDFHIFLDGIIHEQANHILPRHHHLPGYPVSKIEHIVDEPAFHRIDAAAFFTGTDHFPDIILRMAGSPVDRFFPHEMVQGFPHMPEQKSKRIYDWFQYAPKRRSRVYRTSLL